MSGIVFDYNNINAKLNGIDIDKEAFKATFKTFYDAYHLEVYKAYSVKCISFDEFEKLDKTDNSRVFFESFIKYLIAHGYNP